MEIRLNKASVAPRGHAVRQNGLFVNTAKAITRPRRLALNQNHQPTMPRMPALEFTMSPDLKWTSIHAPITIGKPASMVPAGQRVQKNVSLTIGGRMITSRTSEAYLPYSRKCGICFLCRVIRPSKSWKKPNGQRWLQ